MDDVQVLEANEPDLAATRVCDVEMPEQREEVTEVLAIQNDGPAVETTEETKTDPVADEQNAITSSTISSTRGSASMSSGCGPNGPRGRPAIHRPGSPDDTLKVVVNAWSKYTSCWNAIHKEMLL